ncbi:hypothetical protein G3N92_14060 [Burkholderia sp. Ac-20379]|nr:hypothetical protein [Burkholderia sp. Ac-20379]
MSQFIAILRFAAPGFERRIVRRGIFQEAWRHAVITPSDASVLIRHAGLFRITETSA